MKMTRKQFYTEFVAEFRNAMAALRALATEKQKLQAKIDSRKYAQEYVAELRQKVRDLERKIEDEKISRTQNLNNLVSQMEESLNEEVELRGGSTTDDLKLLSYNLKPNEYVYLLNRYESNPTMFQLILRDAKEKGIQLPIYFDANRAEHDCLRTLVHSTMYPFRHPFDEHKYLDLYMEGSHFAEVFNVDDKYESAPPMIEYSNEKVANAINLLSNRHSLPDSAQRDIVREFKGNPGILAILESVARRNFNHAAKEMAIELQREYQEPEESENPEESEE